MRQLTLAAKRRLEWWDVPEPRIDSDECALVRPLAVARCDLDRYLYLGAYSRTPPYAFGHETAGEVVAVGDGVRTVTPGQRVVVPFQISCGRCINCRRQWTNACTAVPPLAAYGMGTHPEGDWGGALSELLKVPFADAMLLPVPAGLPLSQACGAGDNMADAYRTVAPLLARFPGEAVLVVGGLAESVGLYAATAALSLGAPRVVYADGDIRRIEAASRAGAETLRVDFANSDRAQDDFLITVDASATAAGLAYALRSTAPCGYCTGVSGGLSAETTLPLSAMYLRGITYSVSRVHSRTVLPDVLHRLGSGDLDTRKIGVRELGFSAAPEVMGDEAIKIVFLAEG